MDKTSNSEKVLITSNCSCVLNWVSVRYLVVQPALATSVQLIPIERSYSTPQLLQSSTNTIITITYSPFQGSSATLQPAAILRGITIRNNKNGARNEYIDFQVRATLGASVVITLSGISSQA